MFSKILTIVFLVSFNFFELTFCQKSNTNNMNTKIIIIGAGASGIAAASKLIQNGFNNITILEAENRIGGRIFTTKLGEYSIDLGAQWVHGEVDNVAFEVVESLDLLDVSKKEDFDLDQKFLDSSGNYLSPDISKSLKEFFYRYVYEVDPNDNLKNFEDVGQYIKKAFQNVFKDNFTIMNNQKKYLDHLELVRLSIDSAESWYDISASEISLYKICSGDQMANWKKRGYSTILDVLMKRYPSIQNELPILKNTKLNTEVISINYSNRSEEPLVELKASNGQIYKANHVIVTVSLGVLKDRHTSLFTPSLPDYKVNAIEGIGFGAVAKIIILFQKPFWNLDGRDKTWYSLIWNDDYRKQIETDLERRWLLGIAGAMPVEHKPELLLLWVTGKYVKLMEKLSDEKIFNHSFEILQKFFGKLYNISTPISMMRSRWYTNPYFKGTYSYRSTEAQKRQVYPEMLEKPLDAQNLRVLFAGEATESERFSTVDGAIKSGWKAADRLIKHYKISRIATVPNS